MATTATFEIEITPAKGVLPTTGRFDFAKVWTGGAEGTSKGVMLSGGDPSIGTAGYVAIEVFEGEIGGRAGTITFQQFGSMVQGEQRLTYEVTPGSGTDALVGVTGELHLTVDEDGVHHVRFELS